MAVLRQIWCMSAVYLMFLNTGLTSVASFEENLDSKFLAWNGILVTVGYMTSSLLIDVIGRQSTYILGILPGLVSCILMNSTHTKIESLGRALSGISFGATSILGLIIVAEYTSSKNRAVFLNMTTTSIYLGYLFGKMLSTHLQWTTIIETSLVLHILSLGITLTWPKSPYWLAWMGCHEESEASFDRLRGTDKESRKERKELLCRNTIVQTSKQEEKFFGFCKTCLKADFRRPVTIIIFGAILAEASGRHYLPMFADKIIAMISNDIAPQNLFVNITILFSSVFACVLLGTFRNRTLLSTTGTVSILAMFFGSILIFLSSYKVISLNLWICLLLLVLQIVFSNLGSTSIPIALIGEIFPLESKAAGIFVAGIVTSITSWAFSNMIPSLLATCHVYGTLAVLGLLVTISLLFLMFILPETQNRSLLEVEDYFSNGWYSEDACDCEESLTRLA